MVSSSTDKTVAIWDFETGAKLRSLKGHTSIVNSCCYFARGRELVVSGSDDNTMKVRFLLFKLSFSDLGLEAKECGADHPEQLSSNLLFYLFSHQSYFIVVL